MKLNRKLIFDEMTRRGWKIKDLAEKAGLSYWTLHRILHQKERKNYTIALEKLAWALDKEGPEDILIREA